MGISVTNIVVRAWFEGVNDPTSECDFG